MTRPRRWALALGATLLGASLSAWALEISRDDGGGRILALAPAHNSPNTPLTRARARTTTVGVLRGPSSPPHPHTTHPTPTHTRPHQLTQHPPHARTRPHTHTRPRPRTPTHPYPHPHHTHPHTRSHAVVRLGDKGLIKPGRVDEIWRELSAQNNENNEESGSRRRTKQQVKITLEESEVHSLAHTHAICTHTGTSMRDMCTRYVHIHITPVPNPAPLPLPPARFHAYTGAAHRSRGAGGDRDDE